MSRTTFNQLTNDKQNLQILLQRYVGNSLGAKGLIHGLQKDIIQNCVGATSTKKFQNWKVTLELTKIDDKDALIVTDEGTTGLTGEVYTQEEIIELSRDGNLGVDQNLSRFLNKNFTGGNVGPGSKGQGKGLFHLISKNYEVVFDSLRDEGKENESYVCGQKSMNEITLENLLNIPTDPSKPNKEENYKLFEELTHKQLTPLKKQGTRIIIKNIGVNDVVKEGYKDSVNENFQFEENNWLSFVDIFNNSFKKDLYDPDCILSFKNMILETWWELLRNFSSNGAKIILKSGDKIEEVTYEGSLIQKVYEPKADQSVIIEEFPKSGERIFWENDNKKYKIKKIKLIHFKNKRPALKAGCFLQRRYMKVGEIIRDSEIYPETFKNNFFSWVTLEKEAEDEIQHAENEVHYGFNINKGGCKKLRKKINEKLTPFTARFTGVSNRTSNADEDLYNSFRSIMTLLSDVGSFSDFSLGSESTKIKINFLEIKLPENNPSVNYVSSIGPIKIGIHNPYASNFDGKILLTLSQTNVIKTIEENAISIPSQNTNEYSFNEFKIPGDFQNGRIYLKVSLVIGNIEKAKNTRLLFLNEPVPAVNEKYVSLKVSNPILPNPRSMRIDQNDEIKNIIFSFYSIVQESLNVKIKVFLERRNEHDSPEEFHGIYLQDYQLEPFLDNEVKLDDLLIDESIFGFYEQRDRLELKREMRMVFKIESNEFYPSIDIAKGETLCRSVKTFYFGIDTSGKNIFKDVKYFESKDSIRSRISGNISDGFICEINTNTNELNNIVQMRDEAEKKEFKNDYQQREMIRQAVMVCVQQGNYNGNIFNLRSYQNGPGRGDIYSNRLEDEIFQENLKDFITLTEEIIDRLTARC